LFRENGNQANHPVVPSHNDEVETVTIHRGLARVRSLHKLHEHNHIDDQCDCSQNTPEDDGTDSRGLQNGSSEPIEQYVLESALHELSKESIWRVKGFVRLKPGNDSGMTTGAESQVYILNWAFGRYDLTPFLSESGLEELGVMRLTIMGERGEVRRAIRRFSVSLSAQML
jgi:G3E family GTPase